MSFNSIFNFHMPFIFVFIGIIAWLTAPLLEPNGMMGFRTKNSLKSKEAFLYANKKMGIAFIIGGVVALILDMLVYAIDKSFALHSSLITLFPVIITIPLALNINSTLKKKFK